MTTRSKNGLHQAAASKRSVATVTVSKKGWVVIPKEMRERHGIAPGDRVNILEIDKRLVLMRAFDDPIEAGFGLLKGSPSMTQALLKERASELEQEERDLPPPPAATR